MFTILGVIWHVVSFKEYYMCQVWCLKVIDGKALLTEQEFLTVGMMPLEEPNNEGKRIK